MKAKTFARKMVNKFYNTEVDMVGDLESVSFCFAKKCAIICINYLIQEQSNNYYFYIEVKKEINKLNQ